MSSRTEKLARHTSYRIGGKADLFVTCHSYHSLRRTIEVLARERVPWVIIGKGSNLLVADAGYRGAVITLGSEFSRFVVGEDGCTITVGAGAILARLVNEALSRELTGLEFAVGIPGTVGGAISMNAGSRTEWIGSLVRDVVTYKPGEGIRHYSGDADRRGGTALCGLPHDEIVLEATLELGQATKDDIRARMERALTRRRRTQPLGVPSCGSVFRNPPDRAVGAMIEECGLKGFCQGGAEVSSVHANFIVNKGAATRGRRCGGHPPCAREGKGDVWGRASAGSQVPRLLRRQSPRIVAHPRRARARPRPVPPRLHRQRPRARGPRPTKAASRPACQAARDGQGGACGARPAPGVKGRAKAAEVHRGEDRRRHQGRWQGPRPSPSPNAPLKQAVPRGQDPPLPSFPRLSSPKTGAVAGSKKGRVGRHGFRGVRCGWPCRPHPAAQDQSRQGPHRHRRRICALPRRLHPGQFTVVRRNGHPGQGFRPC